MPDVPALAALSLSHLSGNAALLFSVGHFTTQHFVKRGGTSSSRTWKSPRRHENKCSFSVVRLSCGHCDQI